MYERNGGKTIHIVGANVAWDRIHVEILVRRIKCWLHFRCYCSISEGFLFSCVIVVVIVCTFYLPFSVLRPSFSCSYTLVEILFQIMSSMMFVEFEPFGPITCFAEWAFLHYFLLLIRRQSKGSSNPLEINFVDFWFRYLCASTHLETHQWQLLR